MSTEKDIIYLLYCVICLYFSVISYKSFPAKDQLKMKMNSVSLNVSKNSVSVVSQYTIHCLIVVSLWIFWSWFYLLFLFLFLSSVVRHGREKDAAILAEIHRKLQSQVGLFPFLFSFIVYFCLNVAIEY